jgi:hypothetical protein
MKSVLSMPTGFRLLFTGVLVVLFTIGCSKHEDDCPAPGNNDTQATTRMSTTDNGQHVIDEERPAGVGYRGVEAGEGNSGGDGINDDGDDEADGEGNKKGRVQH